tara:strand:- start:8273 stop:8995 length:723 start_codon:yes stop_codon:yes gene_type:complete
MALPKLSTPEFNTVIPSTKEDIKFRPFLVKEEKVLYIALEGGEQKEIYDATMNILESCILTPGVKYNELTSYDLEFLFLKLRSKSVGEKIELNVRHQDEEYRQNTCNEPTKVAIDIDAVNIQYNDEHNSKVDLGGGIGIELKDPNAGIFTKINPDANEFDQMLSMMYECTKLVYDADDVYDDFTKQELEEFVGQLTKDQFETIAQFFNTIPALKHEINYTCEACGKSETITIEGLQGFFT